MAHFSTGGVAQFSVGVDNQHIEITETDSSLSDFYNENHTYLKSKILVTFFNSYSLRTRASFISAFLRMGGAHMEFSQHENMINNKTNIESVADTFGFISEYCDCLVVRCDSSKLFKDICESASVPIISAGHGEIENPTTAINYLVSIKRNLGRLDDLSILVIAKPPKRCINSLVTGLKNWKGNSFSFYNPFTGCFYTHDDCVYIEEVKKGYNKPDLSRFDLVFVDESFSDFKNQKEPKFIIGNSVWKQISTNTHFIHAKPIIGLLSDQVKGLVSDQTKLESKNSAVLKSLIFRTLIDI